MSTQTNFPVFEDNQVLTSSQLNDMRNYLDEQERLTRTNLIGIGVADGLEVSYIPRSTNRHIDIACGTGVTSLGYLATLGACSLYSLRVYNLPSGSTYAPFVNTSGVQDVKLWELLTDNDTPGPLPAGAYDLDKCILSPDPLDLTIPSFGDPAFFNDKAVMLFIEIADIDNDSCLGRKCDENGISRTITLRKLLVSKSDLDIIKLRSENGAPDPMNEGKYGLSNFVMRRPLFDPDALNSRSYMDFSRNYVDAFHPVMLGDLIVELKETYTVYESILEPVYGTNPFLESQIGLKIAAWTSYLNGTQTGSAPPFLGIQYFYDFVKDLVVAYDEFCEVAFEIATECCINMGRFERHLAIGELFPDSTCGPTPYRQEFIFARVQEGQRQLVDKAIMLHKRMVMLMLSFEFDLISNPDPAIVLEFITPSFEKRSFLTDRAIPYYYDADGTYQIIGGSSENPYYSLSSNWNFDINRKCRTVSGVPQVQAYDHQSPNQFIDQGPIKTPLKYSLDAYNFLRIEGHLRWNYVDALAKIEQIKNDFDLPFNVIALRLAGDPFDVVEDRCNFEDLRSQYTVLRSSFLCNTGFICNLVTKQVNPGSFISTLFSDINSQTGNSSVAFNPSVPTAVSIGASLSPTLLEDLEQSFPGITHVLFDTPFTSVNSTGEVSAKRAASGEVYVGHTVDGKYAQVSPQEMFTLSDPLNLQVDPGVVIIDKSSPLELVIADYKKFMNELCAQLTLLGNDTLLPFDFKSFKFGADITDPAQSFIKTYISAVSKAISAKVALNRIDDMLVRNPKTRPTPEMYYLVSRYFDEVYDVLNSFIQSCVYKEFEMLYYTYRYRINWLTENDPTLFHNFIRKHPGVEHKAGVQPGGTFILVYNGDNVAVNITTVQEAIVISNQITQIQCEIAALQALQSRTEAQNLQLQYLLSQLALCTETQDALASQTTISIEQIQLQAEQVIADFSLPYLCCCDCDCSDIPAPALGDLALPNNYTVPVFVEYNLGDYAFGTTVTYSREGCSTTVGFLPIDIRSKVIYNHSQGTAFRLKIIQNGNPRSYDLSPDSTGALDAITTSKGGTLRVHNVGSVRTGYHQFQYRPAQNYVGVDEVDYLFETYDIVGKQLSSTPGKLYINITCDCTVVPISNQGQPIENTAGTT